MQASSPGNVTTSAAAERRTDVLLKREGLQRKVYTFEEGDGTMKDVLGGKGAGLAEMTRAGVPVPPGFTITAQICVDYYARGRRFPEELENDIELHVRVLEATTGKAFRNPSNPLLLSVRSGARLSMPGMMDTILNHGLTDIMVESLATLTGNPRFAWDAYRRLIAMFSNVVLGVKKIRFAELSMTRATLTRQRLNRERQRFDSGR